MACLTRWGSNGGKGGGGGVDGVRGGGWGGGGGGGGGVDSIWVLLHSLFIHIGGGEPSDLKGQTEQKHYCAVQPAGKYPA